MTQYRGRWLRAQPSRRCSAREASFPWKIWEKGTHPRSRQNPVIKAIRAVAAPLRRCWASLARVFGDAGYETLFVHSYGDILYDRDMNIPRMGFDRLVYQDDFTVDKTYAGG